MSNLPLTWTSAIDALILPITWRDVTGVEQQMISNMADCSSNGWKYLQIDKSVLETGTILKEQTRLEKSLTKFCGKEYIEKGLILYEQILLSTETDTKYF